MGSPFNLNLHAFPSISTGIYRFPLEEATKIAITEVIHFLENNQLPGEVTFVAYNEQVFTIYKRCLEDEGII